MERRTAERQSFALEIDYELGAATGQGNRACSAKAQDICSNGIGILTDVPLRKGAVLKLNIPMRDLRMRLPVFAEVAWAVPAGNHFRTGLRFLR